MSTIRRITLFAISCILITGCAPPRQPPTPEQIAMQQKMIEALTSRMANAPQATQQYQQPVSDPVPTIEVISESELMQKVHSLQKNPHGQWSLITDGPDGFYVNGKSFVSPRGKVVDFGADEKTGQVVYFAQESGRSLRVEMANAEKPFQSIHLGQVTKQHGSWRFSSITGQVLNGSRIFATSKGVLVVREKAGFHYEAGKGITAFSVPDGFHVAPFQPGDIGSTEHLLLERDSKNQNELAKNLSSMGNIFGFSKHTDYGLLNVSTENFIPIKMSLDDKEVGEYSDCRVTDRKAGMNIRTCDTLTMRESLYDSTGQRNSKHPYWNIYWGQGRNGSFLLAKEGTLGSKLIYVDLNTQQRYVTFKRTLGVNDFSVKRNIDGRITLLGKLGFSRKTIEDLDAFIAQTTPIASAQK